MDLREYAEMLYKRGQAAVATVAEYSQEEIDDVVRVIAKASIDHAEEVAKVNLEETGMGNWDAMFGQCMAAMRFYPVVKGEKSVGLIEEDEVTGLKTYAKPMGVLCCAAPSTTPVFNLIFNAINGLKSGNAIVVSPHPNAKRCVTLEVKFMREALKGLGAPEDLIQVVDEPSVELSGILMETCDAIIAVGGSSMVKAAYSKGKPCFGVGQGNVQAMLGKNYGDIDRMVDLIIENRTGANGVPCTGEQTLWVPREKHGAVLKKFEERGCAVIRDRGILDQMRSRFFGPNGISREIVGKVPYVSLKNVGIDAGIPEDTKLLVVDLNSWGRSEPLSREIMFPIVRVNMYDSFEEAAKNARGNLLFEGAGHTAVLWTTDEAEINTAARILPVGRIVVEQKGNAGSGSTFNGLPWTNGVGCGTWGGNAISENLTFKHLRNYTKVANLKNQASDVPITPEEMLRK
jgi:succinate-semialdehyde dehydrogenase